MNIFRSEKAGPQDFAEFWRATGEKRGGTVGIFTFATYLGHSSDEMLGLPGLMYTVGDTVWFEDFEKDNWLSKLFGSKRKYEKTEVGFPRTEVAFTRVVSRGTAFRCIRGTLTPDKTPSLPAIMKVFSAPVVQVGFSLGYSLFFEVMKQGEIIEFLK